MAGKNAPRRIAVLATLLVAAAAVWLVLRLRPTLSAGTAGQGGRAPLAAAYQVPALGWSRSEERVLPTPKALRNLFTYGAPPTPTPDPRPTPTPLPTVPPKPMPTPTPPGIYDASGHFIAPPPPPFTLAYLGWLGPDRLPVAVFRDGGDVLAVPQGGTVKERFIIRSVGPTAVVIGFTGYPLQVTTQVPISR